jgi:hypothetical protein
MDLLLFLRRTKQHPNKSAAIATAPSGTPTPSPIFARLDRPESLDAGAIGSMVELGVAEELDGDDELEKLVTEDEEVAGVVEDTEEDSVEGAKLDISLERLLEDAVSVGVVLKLSDPDVVEESAAPVDSDSSADESVFEAVPVGSVVTDAVTSVGNASLAGGAAVAGPNSSIK